MSGMKRPASGFERWLNGLTELGISRTSSRQAGSEMSTDSRWQNVEMGRRLTVCVASKRSIRRLKAERSDTSDIDESGESGESGRPNAI